jgi:hypothetical protein
VQVKYVFELAGKRRRVGSGRAERVFGLSPKARNVSDFFSKPQVFDVVVSVVVEPEVLFRLFRFRIEGFAVFEGDDGVFASVYEEKRGAI